MTKAVAYHFTGTQAQDLLKPGELRALLSRADRAVLNALEGNRRLSGPALSKKTGLSRMALLLANYRLVGLGLINQYEPGAKRPIR
jgi:hypothetical protein